MTARLVTALLGLLLACAAPVMQHAQASTSPPAAIISGPYLLGSFERGQWLDAATTASRLSGRADYRIYTPRGYAGTSRAEITDDYTIGCDDTEVMEFTPQPQPAEFVAVGGAWQPMPRATRSYSTSSRVYQEAIAALLRDRGISSPDVRLTQVIRVDLEGDGVDEVLISATRLSLTTPSAEAGDYSLVVLRKIIDGRVATIELEANVYPQAMDFIRPNRYTIAGVLDLSGDGRLEVVINRRYYEGAGASVYQISGGNVARVLSGGCGL